MVTSVNSETRSGFNIIYPEEKHNNKEQLLACTQPSLGEIK